MSLSKTEINATTRSQGKHHSRHLRMNKLIPAVAYGPKIENLLFSVPELMATRLAAAKYDSEIFILRSENKAINGLEVLRKAVDKHPLTHRPVHLDFYALDSTQLIKVPVEIHIEGVSPGVKEEGGILNILLREVEVESLPSEIPDKIIFDVSHLHLNDVVHVSDLKLPESAKAKITSSQTEAVIKISKSTASTEADTPATTTDAAAPAADTAATPAADDGADKKKS